MRTDLCKETIDEETGNDQCSYAVRWTVEINRAQVYSVSPLERFRNPLPATVEWLRRRRHPISITTANLAREFPHRSTISLLEKTKKCRSSITAVTHIFPIREKRRVPWARFRIPSNKKQSVDKCPHLVDHLEYFHKSKCSSKTSWLLVWDFHVPLALFPTKCDVARCVGGTTRQNNNATDNIEREMPAMSHRRVLFAFSFLDRAVTKLQIGMHVILFSKTAKHQSSKRDRKCVDCRIDSSLSRW